MLKLLCRFWANCRVRKTIGTAQFSRRNASNRARSAEIILHFTAQYCVPGAERLVYLADYLSLAPMRNWGGQWPPLSAACEPSWLSGMDRQLGRTRSSLAKPAWSSCRPVLPSCCYSVVVSSDAYVFHFTVARGVGQKRSKAEIYGGGVFCPAEGGMAIQQPARQSQK